MVLGSLFDPQLCMLYSKRTLNLKTLDREHAQDGLTRVGAREHYVATWDFQRGVQAVSLW